MRMYKMPPDTRDKEKLFGGLFTISQFICLVVCILIGASFGLLLYSIFKSIVVLIFGIILGFIGGVPFVVYRNRKMGDMELFRYLLLRYKFKKKIKKKIHINENYQRYGGGKQI